MESLQVALGMITTGDVSGLAEYVWQLATTLPMHYLIVWVAAIWVGSRLVMGVLTSLRRLVWGRSYLKALPPLSADGVEVLRSFVDSDSLEFRQRVKAVFRSEKSLFVPTPQEYDLCMQARRDLNWRRIRRFQEHKLVGVRDIVDDPLKFIAAHEVICQTDPAFVYFFSVHFNLFGGSVLKLGTAKHHNELLDRIDSVDVPGCFALTEFRHGVNSGFFLDTTAKYDEKSQQFVLNTPNTGAQKHWISFAANHAIMAIVFARLLMGEEERDEGVHAFLVNIRDPATKRPLPGVRIEDVGHKPTLNGNDNGRLWFDHVRIGREALLNKFCDVDKDGKYTSDIVKMRERFLKVSDQLMSGRMCIAAASVVISKLSVFCALRFSITRTQVRPRTGEVNLYFHLSQRRALLPVLAQAFASGQAINYVKRRYANQTQKDRAEVLRLVCAFKAYCSCQAVQHSSICREKTGGQGLMSDNKVADWNNVAASLVVVEGDSMLLAQKVAKELLDEARKGGSLAFLLGGAIKSLYHSTRLSLARSSSTATHSAMFAARTHVLTMQLAGEIFDSTTGLTKVPLLEAWSRLHLDTVLHLHRAFVEQTMHDQYLKSIAKCSDASVRAYMQTMCDLYAASKLEEDMGWFLSNTSLPRHVGRSVTQHVNDICHQIKETNCLALLDGMGFPDDINSVPMAVGEMWKTVME